jgi:pimeloyl-ACP methyl ester carboxylesterase
VYFASRDNEMSSLYTRMKITFGRADADADALCALQSSAAVSVSDGADKTLALSPVNQSTGTGVIIYPGGRCDARAYAPIMRPLVTAGHHVFMPQMPLRLAVLDTQRAAKIMASQPAIKTWHIGGHSMGGAMAAAYAFANMRQVAGLFFIASYPAAKHAIPGTELPVTMIYGTHDFITSKSECAAAHERLPTHTNFVEVAGGDHYQFGSFAGMDVTATISRAEQQDQTVAALLAHFGHT